MLPRAQLIHQTQNRLRFFFPEKRRDQNFLMELSGQLKGCATVEQVRVNALTASILVRYHGAIDRIVEFAMQHQLFTTVDAPSVAAASSSHKRALRDVILKNFTFDKAKVNDFLVETSAGQVDFNTLLMGCFLGLSVYQCVQGRMLPAGLVLFWSASERLTPFS